nr:hypothetical protein [Deltaproteobacteria bacterium]
GLSTCLEYVGDTSACEKQGCTSSVVWKYVTYDASCVGYTPVSDCAPKIKECFGNMADAYTIQIDGETYYMTTRKACSFYQEEDEIWGDGFLRYCHPHSGICDTLNTEEECLAAHCLWVEDGQQVTVDGTQCPQWTGTTSAHCLNMPQYTSGTELIYKENADAWDLIYLGGETTVTSIEQILFYFETNEYEFLYEPDNMYYFNNTSPWQSCAATQDATPFFCNCPQPTK